MAIKDVSVFIDDRDVILLIPEMLSIRAQDNRDTRAARAVAAGWTELQIDDGLSWNYLGVCPDCAPANN